MTFKAGHFLYPEYLAVCRSVSSPSSCVYSYTVRTDDEYYIVFDGKILSLVPYLLPCRSKRRDLSYEMMKSTTAVIPLVHFLSQSPFSTR